MEIKEAIEILTDEKMVRKGWYNTLSKETQKIIDGRIAAFDMAISALEKQIPEPPKEAEWYDADGLWRPGMLFCPTCGKVIDPCEHHCMCGQKIEWEETE